MNWGFPRYVPVEEKKERAGRHLKKLRERGRTPEPVEGFRGRVATTPLGESWCAAMDDWADESSRLERGRSYVRAGCVCDLEMVRGGLKAKVSGGRMYTVRIKVAPLEEDAIQRLGRECTLGDVAALRSGESTPNLLRIMANPQAGVIPGLQEIDFTCSCHDYAYMCKHVAAALYGIGRRLDSEPALLLRLRGLDPAALACEVEEMALPELDATLDKTYLENIFGIDIDMGEIIEEAPDGKIAAQKKTPKKRSRTVKKKAQAAKAARAAAPEENKPDMGQGNESMTFARKLDRLEAAAKKWGAGCNFDPGSRFLRDVQNFQKKLRRVKRREASQLED